MQFDIDTFVFKYPTELDLEFTSLDIVSLFNHLDFYWKEENLNSGKLFNDLFDEAYLDGYDSVTYLKWILEALNNLKFNKLHNELNDCFFLIAKKCNIKVACMILEYNYKENALEILRLYVKPSYRGKNIASNLIALSINIAKYKSANNIVLKTLMSQENAVNLYEKLDFKQTRELENKVGDYGKEPFVEFVLSVN